ncbi:MAG: hypothetical protein EXQ85_09190 [Alphaproteobacteria bacterium]|nr:hypothetical protein [Alphaproteobacteria bacterium]
MTGANRAERRAREKRGLALLAKGIDLKPHIDDALAVAQALAAILGSGRANAAAEVAKAALGCLDRMQRQSAPPGLACKAGEITAATCSCRRPPPSCSWLPAPSRPKGSAPGWRRPRNGRAARTWWSG